MAFIDLFLGFLINLVMAAIFVLINTGLFLLSGKVSKIISHEDDKVKLDDTVKLKALACGIYAGLAGMVLAYINAIPSAAFPVMILFVLLAIPVVKFVYEKDWKDKELYFMWSIWLFCLFAVFLVIYGITKIL